MGEYSDEWLIARAEVSKALLEGLPAALQGNFVLASATLPAMPASREGQSFEANALRQEMPDQH